MVGGEQKVRRLYFPSSWWSISDEVRAIVSKHSVSFSVRLTQEDALGSMFDISQICAACSSLALKMFSHPIYPDYVYRNLYLKPDMYEEMRNFISEMFQELAKEISVKSGTTAVSKVPYISVLSLDKNHKLKHDFINQLSPEDYYLATDLFYGKEKVSTNPDSSLLEQEAKQFLSDKFLEYWLFGYMPRARASLDINHDSVQYQLTSTRTA